MTRIVETYPDTDALVAAAGDRLVAAICSAIAARGKALIVLTGGGTGIGLLKHVGAHDDGIVMISRKGHGPSTFRLSLSAAAPAS